MITDFYKFFQESWACAIYHDRFDKLQELNQRDLLRDDQGEDLNLLKIISEKIIENNHKRVSIKFLWCLLEIQEKLIRIDKAIISIYYQQK